MTTENLGIVFAPNLLRAPNATEISVMDLQVGNNGCIFFYLIFVLMASECVLVFCRPGGAEGGGQGAFCRCDFRRFGSLVADGHA